MADFTVITPTDMESSEPSGSEGLVVWGEGGVGRADFSELRDLYGTEVISVTEDFQIEAKHAGSIIVCEHTSSIVIRTGTLGRRFECTVLNQGEADLSFMGQGILFEKGLNASGTSGAVLTVKSLDYGKYSAWVGGCDMVTYPCHIIVIDDFGTAIEVGEYLLGTCNTVPEVPPFLVDEQGRALDADGKLLEV